MVTAVLRLYLSFRPTAIHRFTGSISCRVLLPALEYFLV